MIFLLLFFLLCVARRARSTLFPYTTLFRSGLSLVRSDIAGAESFHSLEGNMCGIAMRGADALPGSKATSRAKGSYRNLGYLLSGRRCRVCAKYGGPHREGEEP